ncbi:MAG: ABC transporter substrate-binding protein [Gemella sp.]|nr:ABC transporter substrate-binding protein [Gemella sp.]
MKNKKFLKIFSSAMAVSLIVAGCSTGSSSTKKDEYKTVEFKEGVQNTGNPVDSTFKMGIIFAGTMDMNFSQFAKNSTVNSFKVQNTLTETGIAQDDKYRFKENDPSRPFQISIDKDKKTLTYKISDGLKWSNGKAVTAKDIVATYELALHPKTEYLHIDGFRAIEGANEYIDEKAATISGIKEIDDKTVEIKFKEISPTIYFGDGVFKRIENAEQIEAAKKDIEKLAESELNTKPLSYGPYVIGEVKLGEAVTYKPNEHYWKKDEVKLKNVELKRIVPAQASQVIKAGEVDTLDVTEDMYESVKDLKNGTVLGTAGNGFSFIGFKLGSYDAKKKVSVMDPNSKLADARVREAFAVSVDWDKINAVLYKGLRQKPTGTGQFPPFFEYITDKNSTGYKFDPEKAKKLLDEAGLKDTNGDGIREGKDGKELTFNYLARQYASESAQTSQAFVDEVIKSWKEVGLNVKQLDNKLFNSTEAWPLIRKAAPEVDLYGGSFPLGTNPNNMIKNFLSKSPYNYNRVVLPELDKLEERTASKEMFDDAKFVETFRNIDKEVANLHLNIPVTWSTDLQFVNNRVKHYDLKKLSKGELDLHELELTATEPAKG